MYYVMQHFRNFLGEMPNRGKSLGYEELGPEQVANEVFGRLQPGDKVAITMRDLKSDGREQGLVAAFEKRGITARIVRQSSDMADFCFLMRAQKELVGTSRSSFFTWAGLLGNATRVRSYSIDSPTRRRRGVVFEHYNWTHPDLQSRFLFELYKLNESMAWNLSKASRLF
jgi:hypothetical protein